MIKKKILFILLFLFMPIINVKGEELNLAASAGSAILIESTTGKILYERNAHEKMAPASMTKIMTMLLIMEAIDEGKISLDQNINISANAASMGGSQVFLEPNTQMKANELIKSIAIASANDAAVAMAETISGTTDAFVKKMNEKCKALGCENTSFVNVHGLDDPNHYSTAKDMSLIASELLKHEDILKYTSIYDEYLKKPDGSTTWMVNTNKLIRFYNGLDGLKTGYTKNAEYCLTATAKRNGMRLISVLMKEPTSQVRNSETVELLNYGFSNYKIKTIIEKEKSLGEVEVVDGKKEKVMIKLKDAATALEKINDEKNYSYNINVDKIKAPVKVGDVIGYLEITENGTIIKNVDITVTENVNKANIWDLYKRYFKKVLSGN